MNKLYSAENDLIELHAAEIDYAKFHSGKTLCEYFFILNVVKSINSLQKAL